MFPSYMYACRVTFSWDVEQNDDMSVDEFNLDDNEYMDYGSLNGRLKKVLDSMEAGTFVPRVKIRWRKSGNDKEKAQAV